jgi:hypothetical protein
VKVCSACYWHCAPLMDLMLALVSHGCQPRGVDNGCQPRGVNLSSRRQIAWTLCIRTGSEHRPWVMYAATQHWRLTHT